MSRRPLSSRLSEILAELGKIETDARLIEKRSVLAIRAAKRLARDLKKYGVDPGNILDDNKPVAIDK